MVTAAMVCRELKQLRPSTFDSVRQVMAAKFRHGHFDETVSGSVLVLFDRLHQDDLAAGNIEHIDLFAFVGHTDGDVLAPGDDLDSTNATEKFAVGGESLDDSGA